MRVLTAAALVALAVVEGATSSQRGLPSSTVALTGEGAAPGGRLAAGESSAYTIPLAADDFVYIVVQQKGVDVVLRFEDPAGMPVIETDSPLGDSGPERIAYVASLAGQYRLEIVAGNGVAKPGDYDVTVAALRKPTERDRVLVAAERAFVDGRQAALVNSAGSRERAIREYSSAATSFKSALHPYEAGLALYRVGAVRLASGEPRPALESLTEALAVVDGLGEKTLHASILNAIGGAHDILGNLSAAADSYERALAMTREARPELTAVLLGNIGKVYGDQSDWQRSLTYYRQALELYVSNKDVRREGTTLNNIGAVYNSLGDADAALEYFERAIPLRRAAGDKTGEANTLTAAGNVHRDSGRIDRALGLYDQALTLRRAVGDRRSEALTLVAMAETHRIAGRAEQARPLYEQALSLQRAAGDKRREAQTLGYLAKAAHATPERAREYQGQALSAFRALGDRNGVADMLTEGARLSRSAGQLPEARARIEEALAIIEDVRGGVTSDDLRASFFAGRHASYLLAIDVLMALESRDGAAGHGREALEMSERARARSLLDLLSASGASIRQGVAPAMVDRETRLGRDLNAKADRLMTAAAADRDTLSREIATLQTEYGEVQAAIRQSSPAYAALTQPHALSLAEIQRDVLDDDTVLLEYSLGETASYLWRVDRRGFATFTLPAADVLTAAVQDVRRLTTTRPAAAGVPLALKRAIARLSDLVVKPLGPDIAGKRLAIVADGALEYVPFAMLTTPGTDGVPLVASCELVTLPSASALAVVRDQQRGRERPTRGLAVLADPVFQKDDVRLAAKRSPRTPPVKAADAISDASRILVHDPAKANASDPLQIPRLPFTRTEATNILRTAAGSENFEAVGFDATKDVVVAGTLKPYRFVHFATHGYVDSTRPVLSSLVFSTIDREGQPRDGFLRSHEIFNLELLADVVVLSACETGLGREVKGEGLVGLTRGFMYAGAPRVVVSLWSVSDRATATLMGHFYEEMIRNGRTPAAALRAAQRAMMRDPRWAHPYYWSAFVLEGEWRVSGTTSSGTSR